MLGRDNPANLGDADLLNVVYLFYLRENGAKLQKIFVGTANLTDTRPGSKLVGFNEVLFDQTHTFKATKEDKNFVRVDNSDYWDNESVASK